MQWSQLESACDSRVRHRADKDDSPGITILEDDVVFAESWFPKTLEARSRLRQTSRPSGWLFLRLIFTNTALVWEASVNHWYGDLTVTFYMSSNAYPCMITLVKGGLQPDAARAGLLGQDRSFCRHHLIQESK